jgi:serine/threonine protein phosphatase 1
MNTYVIGDIHGAYKALIQCIERSGFNKEEDLLITLGDIVDSFPEVGQIKETVDELLTIKNRIDIRGNHDEWFIEFIDFSVAHKRWVEQGGEMTLKSYNAYKELIPEEHIKFFKNQHYYYIDDNNRLFVHGGYNWHKDITASPKSDLTWDRHMYQVALQWEAFALTHPTHKKEYFKDFNEIFIGHTSTAQEIDFRYPKTDKPIHVVNLWNLDTGGGGKGRLTIMNVDTKEYWQSDLISELYPEE